MHKKNMIWGNEEPNGGVPQVGNGNNNGKSSAQVIGQNNRIYFYSDSVDSDSILELNKELKIKDSLNLARNAVVGTTELDPIVIHINSPGGFVTDGLAGMDTLRRCKSPVFTIVEGCVASAATFLSVVGKKRMITKHSIMLIHQLSSAFWGTYEEFLDEKRNLDLLMGIIKGIYKEYTKVPMDKLDEILKHDLYLDSKKCLEYGLVDEII